MKSWPAPLLGQPNCSIGQSVSYGFSFRFIARTWVIECKSNFDRISCVVLSGQSSVVQWLEWVDECTFSSATRWVNEPVIGRYGFLNTCCTNVPGVLPVICCPMWLLVTCHLPKCSVSVSDSVRLFALVDFLANVYNGVMSCQSCHVSQSVTSEDFRISTIVSVVR